MDLPSLTHVKWPKSHRIIRSRFPPIELFEDIADPADWQAIVSAESKTNPRLAETVGNLDLVPQDRRVSGQGASWVMAPFTHFSPDRRSRFSNGTYGVYYSGDRVEVALFETIHHHALFMAATDEKEGWTSNFRELIGSVNNEFHDITNNYPSLSHPDKYAAPQALALELRANGSNGILYKSVRYSEGCALAVFWPDVITIPVQGDHYSYYWDGNLVSRIRNLSTQKTFEVEE